MRMNGKSLVMGWLVLALCAGGYVLAGNSGIDLTAGLLEAKLQKIVELLDTVMSTSTTINGETIADDTIDDDSIDFGDVTYADLSGNIAVASLTNGLKSAGASIGGNIPVAAITNAAVSLGASIGGNIPVAALTNVLGAVRYTGIVTNGPAGYTNILTFVNGICTAASLNP
jgi:hypothetical protein